MVGEQRNRQRNKSIAFMFTVTEHFSHMKRCFIKVQTYTILTHVLSSSQHDQEACEFPSHSGQ